MKNLSIFRTMAVLGSLCLLSACARSSVKTSPLFDDDFSKGNGPAEDRVNLWPVFYWRDPALSLLWPLVTVTGDASAVIPFYEYSKKDGDLRIGTLPLDVPPLLAHTNRDGDWQRVLLAYHDGKSGEFDVFPVFFHDADGTWTPLYSKSTHLEGVLGPLFNRYHDDRIVQWNLPWPVAGWWSGKDRSGSKLIPAWHYDRDGTSQTLDYLFPLGWSGHKPGADWNAFFPLWYAKNDQAGSRVYSLPLIRADDAKSSLTLALLAAYVDRRTSDTRYQAWLWPLAHRFSGPGASGHSVVPFYLYERTPAGVQTVYTPLASWSDDGSFMNAGVVLFNQTSKEGRSEGAALWPLVRWWNGKEESGNSVLPLYYWNRTGTTGATLITPAGGYSRSPERSVTDVLGPVYFERASADGSKTYRAALWPIWREGSDGDERWNALLPLYSWQHRKTGDSFASLPWLSSNEGDRISKGALLDLIGWTTNEKRGELSHHAFPFYSWSSDAESADLDLGLSFLAGFHWTRGDEAAARERAVKRLQARFAAREKSGPASRSAAAPPLSTNETLMSRNVLLFVYGSRETLSAKTVPLADGGATSPGETILAGADGNRSRVVVEKSRNSHSFPLYNFNSTADESGTETSADREILWRLYDSKMKTNDDGTVYERQRVLWRLFRRETQAGRTSIDVFPFVASDSDEKSGAMQWSFAGGLLGWKREADRREMKLLYIPIGL